LTFSVGGLTLSRAARRWGGLLPSAMFTSQSLRAIRPGDVAVTEQRLDDVVHEIVVRGSLSAKNVPAVGSRIEAALAGGVRWLIVDVSGTGELADEALDVLVGTAEELRFRRGELVVAGAPPAVVRRLGAWEPALRPALATTVDQAVMILKLLRPKTEIHRDETRAIKRITPGSLPRIAPT
jgi:anti-anti-sigma regulatory factor